MNELEDLVEAMSKIIRKQDVNLLHQYLKFINKGEVNLARIISKEMYNHYTERINESDDNLIMSALSGELYQKTIERH